MIEEKEIKSKFKIRKPKKIGIKVRVKKASRKKKIKEYSDFIGNNNSEISKYTKGAFLGGLVGGVGGLLIGKKIILGIIIGALAGGYISYQINKESNKKSNIKN
jgi:uncharacterized protein YcfJ